MHTHIRHSPHSRGTHTLTQPLILSLILFLLPQSPLFCPSWSPSINFVPSLLRTTLTPSIDTYTKSSRFHNLATQTLHPQHPYSTTPPPIAVNQALKHPININNRYYNHSHPNSKPRYHHHFFYIFLVISASVFTLLVIISTGVSS